MREKQRRDKDAQHSSEQSKNVTVRPTHVDVSEDMRYCEFIRVIKEGKKNSSGFIEFDGSLPDQFIINKAPYTTSDIVKNLKIPFGRLREWLVRGFVQPSWPSSGQGRPARFTIHDLYRIKAFMNMVDNGFTRECASDYVQYLPESSSDRIPYTIIFLRRFGYAKERTVPIVFESREDFMKNFIDRIALVEDIFEWTDIFILNYKRICEEVHRAMGL